MYDAIFVADSHRVVVDIEDVIFLDAIVGSEVRRYDGELMSANGPLAIAVGNGREGRQVDVERYGERRVRFLPCADEESGDVVDGRRGMRHQKNVVDDDAAIRFEILDYDRIAIDEASVIRQTYVVARNASEAVGRDDFERGRIALDETSAEQLLSIIGRTTA